MTEDSAFKTFEKAAWEDKASRYDNTWGLVSTQAIPHITQFAKPEMSVLDVGCGPGHLCAALKRVGVSAVMGCDYSGNMVKIASGNYPEISFRQEDAGMLSFSSESFDFVTLNYVLLHVEDQEKALLEAARVLKKGGLLLYTTWLAPTESPGLALMFAPVKEFADLTVIPPAPDIFTFAHFEVAKTFLSHNGFTDISSKTLQTHWEVSGGEEFFQAVQAGTRIGGTIDLQKQTIKDKIKDSICSQIESFKQDSQYVIPTPSLLVSARKAL